MADALHHALARMPKVDRLLGDARLAALPLQRSIVRRAVQLELERLREALRSDVAAGRPASVPDDATMAARVLARLARWSSAPQPVINATGVLLHTNLGRAPLSARAAAAVNRTMSGSCAIELDLETGKRGRRGAFVEDALCRLTGAEAALVVNNCAAAVLLVLSASARGREVIVSRGELIEIGGGFRVPEIMAESGAELVEVGTTNKTRAEDYARALDAHPSAAAILRVHQGNFRQIGFVERPPLAELGALARERGVALLKDLGGGALLELGATGFRGEPTVEACVASGCTAITFSGDKVMGGPQCGVIVGERGAIERARRHPLARALRVGRLPMVALEGTLESYLRGAAFEELPVLAQASAPIAAVEARAIAWRERLAALGLVGEVRPSEVEMGGGALAGRSIPSFALALAGGDALLAALRRGDPAVVARSADGAVLLDARTVLPGDEDALLAAVVSAAAPG